MVNRVHRAFPDDQDSVAVDCQDRKVQVDNQAHREMLDNQDVRLSR
jgi:hypothetical protein